MKRGRTTDQLRKLGPAVTRELAQAIFAAGETIGTTAQISITSGSVSGDQHVPSLPGEAPNNDSGVLANNIEVNRLPNRPLAVRVSSKAPYASMLEFGTSRMAARPYFRPAINKARPEVQRLLAKALRRAINKAGK